MRSDTAPILIAVGDPILHPEATHLAAATGRPLIDAHSPADITRHHSRAFAVLIDDENLPAIANLPGRHGVFHLRSDSADGLTGQAPPGASDTFALPAQAADLLGAIGKLALRAVAGAASSLTATTGTVLTFIGAAGGAGTSTLAAAVARTAAADVQPVIVDAHRYSGGIDLLLGVEDIVGARWGDLDIGQGSVDRVQLRQALPATKDGIGVLTGTRTVVPEAAGSAQAAASDLDRVVTALGTGGLTVVDAPADGLPNRCDHAFILAPAEVRAAAAAALIAAECRGANIPVSIVLRHRGWSGMTAEEMANVTNTEVVAELKHLPKLVRAVEVGGLPERLPRPLRAAAKTILKAAS
nr:Flp pilus assembly protein, ATPase CpaE [Streptococcus thermophilus]